MIKKAQILVETIIGVGVVVLLLAAIIPLFIVGIKAGPEAWKSDTAWMLGQEFVEGAKAAKSENWNNLYQLTKSSPYHLVNNAGIWQLVAGAQNLTINNLQFSRQLVVDNVSRTDVNGAGDLEETYHLERDDPSTQKITLTVTWAGSAGITLIDYLTRFQNATWLQTDWSGGAGQANWSDQTRYWVASSHPPTASDVDASQTGVLKLAQFATGGSTPYGNQFLYSSASTRLIQGNGKSRLSMKFTAQASGNVNQVRLYMTRSRNVTFRYGIQSDSGGSPSGTWLASTTANFGNDNTDTWRTINLDPAASLVASTVYHFVVQYESGPNNQAIEIQVSSPNNLLVPFNMATDTNLNVLEYGGAPPAWTALNLQPIYVLGFADSTYEGNPYDSRTTRSISGATIEGEVFTVAQDTIISGAALYVSRSSDNGDDLYVNLYDITNSSDLVPTEVFATRASVGNSLSWISHNFSGGDVTLPANNQFKLSFTSAGSTPGQAYTAVADTNTPNLAEYQGLTWEGVNSFEIRNAANNLNLDLTYYLILASALRYQDYGYIESSSFDTANAQGAAYNRMTVILLESLPVGTKVRIQLAVNNDNATWNYQGPAGVGGGADWYEMTVGETSHSWAIRTGLYDATAPQPARYIRYKFQLESTTPWSATPKVHWIRINYSP